MAMNTTAEKSKNRAANRLGVNRQICNARIVLRELRGALEDLDDRRELARAKMRHAGKAGAQWEVVKKEFGFDF